MRRSAILFLCVSFIAGCSQHGGTIRGKAPGGTARSISSAKKAAVATILTVRGTMVEK